MGDEEKKKQVDCLVSFYRIPSNETLGLIEGRASCGRQDSPQPKRHQCSSPDNRFRGLPCHSQGFWG